MAIGELPFQRIALAAGIESLGLQDVQIRFLLARAQLLRWVMRGRGPSCRRWGGRRRSDRREPHEHIILIRRRFVRRVDGSLQLAIARISIVVEYQIV